VASTVKRFARPAVICCVVVSVVAVSTGLYLYHRSHAQTSGGTPAANQSPTWAPSSAPPLMAGESLWNGIPSMLWGSNDTQIWDPQHSLIIEPAIQQEAKADHLALMRVWLFQTDLATNLPETDAYQESKVRGSLATGAKLLCELPTGNTMSYDEHMVTLFKGQCSYYEFMNEPDYEQVSISTYVSEWSSEIPILRSIDPQAKFGGPAVAAPQYSQCTYGIGTTVCYMQKVLEGMAASKILPDFVTFHLYACWEETASACMADASKYASQVEMVRSWVDQYFGATGASMPIGITEWNADPSAPMPSYTSNPCWMEQFTTTALESMAHGGASFADQLDLADYGGYGSDDMVDIYANGAAKPQYYAMLNVVDQISPFGDLPMPPLSFTQPASCS
jgi:hypothetical protein